MKEGGWEGKGLSTRGKERAVSEGVNLQRIIYSVGTITCKITHTQILKVASPSIHSTATLEAITEQSVPQKMQRLAQQATHTSPSIYLYIHMCVCICVLPIHRSSPNQSSELSIYKLGN